MSNPPEIPEVSEARAWRSLAVAIARGWRLFAADRVALGEYARELAVPPPVAKVHVVMTALLEVANDRHDAGRWLADTDGALFAWFDEAIRRARARLRHDRPRRYIRLELEEPVSALDDLLDEEAHTERDCQLQALLDRGPVWLGRVLRILDGRPDLSFQDACREAGVPLGTVRALRYRYRRRA